MRCPFCLGDKVAVLDSRDAEDGMATRRRRVCGGCEKRFTTYERVEDMPVFVIKKDGRRQRFDREKLHAGIRRATEKRPVSLDQIDAAVVGIERALNAAAVREIDARDIGERVMNFLRQTDEVAYVRFASVYRSFRDAAEFEHELSMLRREKHA